MEKVYNKLLVVGKGLIFISCIFSLYTIIRFTYLNVLYYPDTHPLVIHEYIVLFASMSILLVTIFYKMKYAKVIATLCIALSIINFIGFRIVPIFILR